MYCLHAVSGPDNFSCEKKKPGIFSGQKKFAGPGDPVFLAKIRNCQKIHVGLKFGELVVHPTVG